MPLIQSKKYNHIEQVVSLETWKEMQDKGLSIRYKVVDDRDIQETIIKKPEIFDFVEPEKKAYDGITAKELREELEADGVEYPENATKKELYQLYNG